ncbi:unnamed protein product [Fusarium graminearum]|uniref:Chromosome 3, complete genome n=1 Tax=Gibberella zeae (strain ATCC MYA-4620 / CBS 123657 / FGSC 9075 / NRRL 31084 / PH-1) TaxID=229533 RepID=A0A098DWY1_GIBZE|nr:unnamed protein product [Fusarium graminearum]
MYDIPSTTAEFNGSRRQLRGAWFGMRSLAPPHWLSLTSALLPRLDYSVDISRRLFRTLI